MRQRAILFVAVATVLLGCHEDSVAPATEMLRAHATANGVELTNLTDRPVYFVAAEQSQWGLIDLYPCDTPVACGQQNVPPATTVLVPADRIEGFKRLATIVIEHWQLTPVEGTARYTFAPLRNVRVRVPY